MGIAFKLFSDPKPMKPETAALLNKYIKGAVTEIGFVRRSEAEEKGLGYAEAFVKDGKAKGLTSADIKQKEKEVKAGLKNYGMREKINYAANLRAMEEHPLMPLAKGAATVVGVAAVTLAAAAEGDVASAAAAAGIGTGVAIAAACVYFAGVPKSEMQAKKVEEYTELKHAQLALKQLKNIVRGAEKAAGREAYKEEVRQLYASGLGNPGGMITPVTFAKKSQGR